MSQLFNATVVAKSQRAIRGMNIPLATHSDRDTVYKAVWRFVEARYPNDPDHVVKLVGEESCAGAFASDAADYFVVDLDEHEYIVAVPA